MASRCEELFAAEGPPLNLVFRPKANSQPGILNAVDFFPFPHRVCERVGLRSEDRFLSDW